MKFGIYILFFCLVFHCINLNANKNVVDSLWLRYKGACVEGNDSLLYKLSYEIAYVSREPKLKLHFSKIAYELGIKNRKPNWQAAAKYLNATPYVKLMMLDSAIIYLQESIELYELVNNEEGVATCKYKLADVYKRNKQFDKAEKWYLEAIKVLNKTKSFQNEASAYVNLGELYRSTKRFNLALNCFYKADSIYNFIQNDFGIAYASGNTGLVFMNTNALDSAEVYLSKSISILEPLNDNYGVSCYLDGLAHVYFSRKQYNKAKLTAKKSLKLAQEQNLKEQIRDANLRLSTIYNQSKDYDKAFCHHKEYVVYRDSINNEATIRKIANLNTKYSVAQKQKELDEEKSDKRQYLFVAIALVSIIGLLLIVGYFIQKVSYLRKKTNLELESQHRELGLANATKNKFFSILSHDLRGPLASFHSCSEVIDLCIQHKDLDKLSDISKEIQSASSNMLDLLDNLLQWGINQMGAHEVVYDVVSLKDLVKIEVKHLQHVSNKKQIAINLAIDEHCAFFVDRVSLSIAIRNLINNAVKFTPDGGTVLISGKSKAGVVEIKVKDTGVGMTTEQKDSLFNFNEITSTYGTKNEKGVGLGMQLVCEFIKSCNAKIDVESEVGKGTTFTMWFNVEECAASA